MNRRDFLKTTSMGIVATALTPTIAIASNEIPLYKQFDYINKPVSAVFRINQYPCGKKFELVSVKVVARACRLKIVTDANIDLTQDKIDNYYTNELLLKEIKQNDFTHIYEIVVNNIIDPITYKRLNWYYVRGVKMPEYKTINGKLQVVKVNNEGETEREILTNKWSHVINNL